jgi:branched-subunit amino acid ABC-type transport system permease component
MLDAAAGSAMSELLQRTLDGLLEAGPYALIGLGLTLSFGVLRRINLAFGATALLAAYVGSWLHVRWGVPVLGVWLVVIATSVLVGFYVEWVCFDKVDHGTSGFRRQIPCTVAPGTARGTLRTPGCIFR